MQIGKEHASPSSLPRSDPCLSMEDMISQMPDDVLISIISLIPTKEALGTTILSKRWRYLFRFLSTLTFLRKCGCKHDYDRCTCNPEAFINGVCGILQRHSAHVRSFDFHFCLTKFCTETFEQYIFSLGDLGIQKLKFYSTEFPFNCHLLSFMPSLQHFKLASVTLHPGLKNQCNSLKTIRLSCIDVSPGALECILSNCLSLCTLTLKRCFLPSTICFPRLNLQLKFLVIHDCYYLKEIYIYAPNLTAFDFDIQDPVNLIFDNIPQLQSVYLNSKVEDVPYFCGVLGKYVPTLSTLLLDDIGDLYEDGSIVRGITMFSKLKRLELTVNYGELNLYSVIRVVHGCPRLEEFQLATSVAKCLWPEEEHHVVIHSQLKMVDISGFGGSESEFGFASYLLKSAVNLEQLTISWYKSVYAGFGKRVNSDYSPAYDRRCNQPWPHVYERIQRMKHEAVYKTLQLVAQEFPKTKPKQF